MIERNQVKLKRALDELGSEYSVSSNELLKVLQTEIGKWFPIEDCPKYEKHVETGAIRNRSTHRVLKPNNSGFVKVKNIAGKIMFKKQEVGVDK